MTHCPVCRHELSIAIDVACEPACPVCHGPAPQALCKAAPLMVKALLAVEADAHGFEQGWGCQVCADGDIGDSGHVAGCLVDESLTAAGLPDRASRDAARKALGI